jgi:hypothetical protein
MLALLTPVASAESWSIVLGTDLAKDEAIKLAVDDLVTTGAEYGIEFAIADDSVLPSGSALLVGDASRNALTAKHIVEPKDAPEDPDGQGYRITTMVSNSGRRIMAVRGGSVVGDVYGLYWVWDRIRVHKALPDINTTRIPAMMVRMSSAWGRRGFGGNSKGQMREALRHSTNWVAGPAILDLVPWNSEPEASTNAKNREQARELIDYAHQLHMKYFSFANAFTYHPSLLEEHSATLHHEDPKFWLAVQDKFRKLFTALPGLDGIELCNDDISGFWEDYAAFDPLHAHPESDWSYEKRFRTFVKKVHDVVANEFDKEYFHFTWGLTMHEQHYQAAVYREIFTDDIPTNNLYLMPKITAGDRWWHQPYNTTFNQTPHDTVVCFETMNYYEGGKTNIFPTWSGQYFQAGLQTLLMPEKTNLVGAASLGGIRPGAWDTRGAYAYVLYRLMWDPNEDMDTITRDFASIHFGPDAAEAMADILLMTASAYKYGLHIEPVSYGQFNSFIHMRVNTFPAEGYPSIDHGKEHLEFLRRIYLRCKPWLTETFDDLEHGLAVSEQMIAKYADAKPHIADPKLAENLANRLAMTRALIATNIGYVRTAFMYFAYMDAPTADNRVALAVAYTQFEKDIATFQQVPGYSYNLFGVDVVRTSAKAVLDDVQAWARTQDAAPTRSQLEATVAAQQERYLEVLAEQQGKAVHLATVEVSIDGRDILNITGDQHSIDHLRWDGPHLRVFELHTPLPSAEVTVIPRDNYSRPMHPFILQQPNAENNYTVRIYLDDLPGGQDWMKFDLYYIEQNPEELRLAIPWGE